jgi:hypothetical protein
LLISYFIYYLDRVSDLCPGWPGTSTLQHFTSQVSGIIDTHHHARPWVKHLNRGEKILLENMRGIYMFARKTFCIVTLT